MLVAHLFRRPIKTLALLIYSRPCPSIPSSRCLALRPCRQSGVHSSGWPPSALGTMPPHARHQALSAVCLCPTPPVPSTRRRLSLVPDADHPQCLVSAPVWRCLTTSSSPRCKFHGARAHLIHVVEVLACRLYRRAPPRGRQRARPCLLRRRSPPMVVNELELVSSAVELLRVVHVPLCP